VCSAALSLRKARGMRVRLPLRRLTVAAPLASTLVPFTELIKDEVNVKDVVLTDDLTGYCEQVLTVVPRELGPRVGAAVQSVIRAVKAGEWSLTDGVVSAAGVPLQEGEYELRMVAADAEHSAPLPGGEGVVVLDTEVTPELAAEGLARDVVRVVQSARRSAGLDVADRISVLVEASPAVAAAVETHRDFVAAETLAVSLAFGAAGEQGEPGEVGDGETVRVSVAKV
jgi:isoleucyl-tRNA synthetase